MTSTYCTWVQGGKDRIECNDLANSNDFIGLGEVRLTKKKKNASSTLEMIKATHMMRRNLIIIVGGNYLQFMCYIYS